MFLNPLIRRNPEFIRSALHLHQTGKIPPNSYVIDYETIKGNIEKIQSKSRQYNLTVYPMTKQLSRNPAIIELITELGLKIVAVDWMGAKQVVQQGGKLGHVGHLVQVPKKEIKKILQFRPEVWTVFSYKQAKWINDSLNEADYKQDILLRVWKENNTFYSGHEGGFKLNDIPKEANRLKSLPNVSIAGVTSFPCLLFNENEQRLYTTPNVNTITSAAKKLRSNGFQIQQINAPGTTSCLALEKLANNGATHVEPGHGMTGTTPPHAYKDLEEIPSILYLSEISHKFKNLSYFFGGGLYVDPVFDEYNVKCLAGNSPNKIMDKKYNTWLPKPEAIDYYGAIQEEGKNNTKIGDTVILGFRPQAFVTRAKISVITNSSNKKDPELVGVWDNKGNLI